MALFDDLLEILVDVSADQAKELLAKGRDEIKKRNAEKRLQENSIGEYSNSKIDYQELDRSPDLKMTSKSIIEESMEGRASTEGKGSIEGSYSIEGKAIGTRLKRANDYLDKNQNSLGQDISRMDGAIQDKRKASSYKNKKKSNGNIYAKRLKNKGKLKEAFIYSTIFERKI